MEAQLQGFAGVEAPATTAAAAPTVGNPQADQAGSAAGGPAQEPAPSSLPNGGLDVQMAADGPGALHPLQWCYCAMMATVKHSAILQLEYSQPNQGSEPVVMVNLRRFHMARYTA